MYERLRVPLSFTWEIYGDADAHFYDCFRMFNPVTQEAFDQACALLAPVDTVNVWRAPRVVLGCAQQQLPRPKQACS